MFDPNFPFALIDGIPCKFNRRFWRWEMLIGTKDNIGYYITTYQTETGERKFDKVHRIVWMLHNGPIPDGLEINHIDMDKSNNHISNLELVTHRRNLELAREIKGNWSVGKLKQWQVELLLSIPEGWRVLHELAERWGVSKFHLGNMRTKAKKANDPRYLAGL